jgi:ABC-type molybdate transport system ATPase subunit
MLFQLPALFEGTVADHVRYGPQLRTLIMVSHSIKQIQRMADVVCLVEVLKPNYIVEVLQREKKPKDF